MGIYDCIKNFSLFGDDDEMDEEVIQPRIAESVPEEEKKYYEPDEYYTEVVNPGTGFEFHVTRFEDRKKTAIPSERGLYPAEILLLDYCTKGHFPHPKGKYQGFWWFEYGIRDVTAALRTLEERGFLILGSIQESAKSLTIPVLKELLKARGIVAKGKKADLLELVKCHIPDEDLIALGLEGKYRLSELGNQELLDNAYVPYMHRVPTKTRETSGLRISMSQVGETIIEREGHESMSIPHVETSFGPGECGADDTTFHFNVWSINKLLGTGDKSDWKQIVDTQNEIREQIVNENFKRQREWMRQYISEEEYRELIEQDEQIEAVQKARKEYDANNDLDAYIAFWENLWANGGLKFPGARWHYEIIDVYVTAKRYREAYDFVLRMMASDVEYFVENGEGMLRSLEKQMNK